LSLDSDPTSLSICRLVVLVCYRSFCRWLCSYSLASSCCDGRLVLDSDLAGSPIRYSLHPSILSRLVPSSIFQWLSRYSNSSAAVTMQCTGLLTSALTALAGSARSQTDGLVLRFCWLCQCLRSIPIQQITCFGSGTPAIGLSIDCLWCRSPHLSPVLLALQSMPCCYRCLLTVNLFRSIASAFGRCFMLRCMSTTFVIATSSRYLCTGYLWYCRVTRFIRQFSCYLRFRRCVTNRRSPVLVSLASTLLRVTPAIRSGSLLWESPSIRHSCNAYVGVTESNSHLLRIQFHLLNPLL
jgi:hypothetical protein